ncbi:Os03g0722200, partial [Oryza sativa Japonica Group]
REGAAAAGSAPAAGCEGKGRWLRDMRRRSSVKGRSGGGGSRRKVVAVVDPPEAAVDLDLNLNPSSTLAICLCFIECSLGSTKLDVMLSNFCQN